VRIGICRASTEAIRNVSYLTAYPIDAKEVVSSGMERVFGITGMNF
jgi:hypothetical protein